MISEHIDTFCTVVDLQAFYTNDNAVGCGMLSCDGCGETHNYQRVENNDTAYGDRCNGHGFGFGYGSGEHN